jgi:2-amino-4-hydroxy-6-hydroxymethyldihydropteridine diphosphokinase
MPSVYLSLGSNLGNRSLNLANAVECIDIEIGNVTTLSALYETEPWGFKSSNLFLNLVISAETILNPFQVFDKLKMIEEKLGRSKTAGIISDRIIDIDMLLFDNLIINSASIISPHPRLHERKFVLKPLADIVGEMIHPELKKTYNQLLNECNDQCRVELFHLQNDTKNNV